MAPTPRTITVPRTIPAAYQPPPFASTPNPASVPPPPPPRPSSIASTHSDSDSSSESESESPSKEKKWEPSSNAATTPPLDVSSKKESEKTRLAVPDRFPALNLITALLRSISANDGGRRHAVTFERMLTSANAIYETILAAVVELKAMKEGAGAERKFLFNGYTTATYVLEAFLLALPKAWFSASKGAVQTVPPATVTAEAVEYVHAWVNERNQLTSALDNLRQEASQVKFLTRVAETVNFDYSQCYLDDDKRTAKTLLDFIKYSKLTDRDIIQVQRQANGLVVTEVKKICQELFDSLTQKSSQGIEQRRSASITRALMMVYIPLAILATSETPLIWKTYLRSGPLWDSINGLLTKVKVYAQTSNPGEVEHEFAPVEIRLLKLGEVSIDTSPEMLALTSEITPNAPRPFLFRTVAIIQALEYVDEFSLRPQNRELNGHRHTLKLAMRDAQEELQATFKGVQWDIKAFSTSSRDYQDRSTRLQKQFDKISMLYEEFKIMDEWSRQEEAFKTNAVERDEKHIMLGKTILGL